MPTVNSTFILQVADYLAWETKLGTGQKPITVFIVDDQQEIRKALRELLDLERDIRVIGEAGNGTDAIHPMLRKLVPDVILMDVRMPGINGIEATTRLREVGLRSKVVVLTQFREYLPQAMRAGADAALNKMESLDRGGLASIIRMVVQR